MTSLPTAADGRYSPDIGLDSSPRVTRLRRQWTMFVRNKGAVFGLIVLILWIITALFAPYVAPYDPLLSVDAARQPPSAAYWFGTDRLGRDGVTSRKVSS